ncbi:MAG: S46 family peptidase [Bacteroidota bacterium]|nr:S46 family peptidase [Bacteroidota bacterium]
MYKKTLSLLIIFALILNLTVSADGKDGKDEGMWLPFLVQKLNMKKMKKMGLKLSAEDIYSVNNSSLKDAVIALDHGSCTGELVSAQGLFLTNHHCGYGEIQAHSTVEHDYLTEGFVAETKKDELANPGKTVSFLISAKDVTDQILAKISDKMDEQEREMMIRKVIDEITGEATEGTHYHADVQSFFKGNNYYLFVYETFKDVRLVYAPPSSIGKYGADTDNWMWPRHTGDFSMFRIYTAPDGSPAEYSEENVPLKPRHFFPISMKGYEKGDFAMVMGYPGSTSRYLTADGVSQTMENENKIRIKLRRIKQEIMKSEMDKNNKVRIQYASKYSRSTNYYKYSIGQNNGLKNLNVVAKKTKLEKQLTQWINANKDRKAKYGKTLELINTAVKNTDEYDIAMNYWIEAIWMGGEFTRFSLTSSRALQRYMAINSEESMTELKKNGKDFFKDYYQPIDKKKFVAMMKAYKNDIDEKFHPSFFNTVESGYEDSFAKFADSLMESSIFTNQERYNAFINNPDAVVLKNDLALQVAQSAIMLYQEISQATQEQVYNKTKGERLYMAALKEMLKDKALYPDANSSMRFTYGSVGNYEPRDAVLYKHYTTLDGYMEKEDIGSAKTAEFYVHQKLKDLYDAKDYGNYATKLPNGEKEMRVCFTTNNDITGGNSGSPVLNGKGELMGIAFDGNWEAMSGDIAFETELQKCINVDIRFVLFVIDKYSGATHLIDEMELK